MKLSDLISDLENREVEEVSVFGRNNNWLATCSLTVLSEASRDRYIGEMSAKACDFLGITYVEIDGDEDYIKRNIRGI